MMPGSPGPGCHNQGGPHPGGYAERVPESVPVDSRLDGEQGTVNPGADLLLPRFHPNQFFSSGGGIRGMTQRIPPVRPFPSPL
jgi:hypothetical protein